MYGWDTPNELTMVRTSLGSRNKMFQTGAVAWGGSGSGSVLISMGPGPSGSISWRASCCFAVGLQMCFNGSLAGSGGGGEGRSMSKLKTGEDNGGGASEKSKLFSFK